MRKIEVSTPAEIRKYEKIWFKGFSKRQCLCAMGILIVSTLVYVLLVITIKLNIDVAFTAITLIDMPIVVVGFIPYKGMYFEEYFPSILNGIRQPKKLSKHNIPPQDILEKIKMSQKG